MEYSNKIAVIGCGAWGANHVRVLSELGVLDAIVEPEPDRGAELSAKYNVPLVTLESLWADHTIQAVVIATPAFTHFEIAMHALDAGKDVLVEKPMALNVLDAENLLLQAEAKNRVLMVGHLLRYHPAFLTLQKEIENGRLGKLRYIYSNRLSFGKFRREENILWSFAPHDISMILAVTKSAPNRVYAECAKFLHRDIADSTTTMLTFPGGEHAHIFVSWLHPYKDQRLVVIGEDGMMSFDDSASWDEKISLYMHKIDWKDQIPTPNKADMTFLPVDNIEEPLVSQARHFIDCINTGATPRTSGREGLDVLRILDAAEKSMNSGLPVCPQDLNRHVSGADVHESSIIDVDVEIGADTKIWHFSHVLSQVRIGKNCVLGQNVMVGKGVKIGDKCKIQNNVSIYQGVTLEDGVFCGPSCVFTNVLTPRAEIERKNEFSSTLVKRGATIGANATIVCGNTIGQYAMIGAGAVVTSDVPDYALMTGVPARRTGWVSEAGEVLDEKMTCPKTGQLYRQIDETTLQKITTSD